MTQETTPLIFGHRAESQAQHARSIYVIDDDADVRKSLHYLLDATSVRAWPFAQASDFLEQLPHLTPAPILLDIRMPGIDGIQVLTLLKERDVRWPVIVMTAHSDVPIAVRAMKLGAIEFLEKPFQPDTLDHALGHAFDSLDRVLRSNSERAEARRLVAMLTPREREVLAVLTEGSPNKVVAHRLGLSVRTVEMHRRNALAKLRLKSIPEVLSLLAAADLAEFGMLLSGMK